MKEQARMNRHQIRAAHELIVQLVKLKHEFGRVQMFATMHALEPAMQKAGYELAEQIELLGSEA